VTVPTPLEVAVVDGPAGQPAEQPATEALAPVPELDVSVAAPAPVTAFAAGVTGRRASTETERNQIRHLLGWRYDTYSRTVNRLLAEHPGLRLGAEAGPEALTADLVALCALVAGDGDEPARHGADAALLSCASSGLRRLPTMTGPVLHADPVAAHAATYRPGLVLAEPSLLVSSADLGIALDAPIEHLIWAAAGRRIGLLAGPEHEAEVIFAAGSAFRVLDAWPATDTAPARIFLREVTDGPELSPARTAQVDERLLGRLHDLARRRDADELRTVGDGPARRLRASLGLDQTGRPIKRIQDGE
jgi:hypothetical protein